MTKFTHLNASGEAHMVDVSVKADSQREAIAECIVVLNEAVLTMLSDGSSPKGDVLATARIAGIQGAKNCSSMIPLCHPLPLSKVAIDFEPFSVSVGAGIRVRSRCKTTGKTGVEMEALCAASIAGLTIYDMCKALDKGFVISSVRLLFKSGGKSGVWHADDFDLAEIDEK